MPPKHHLLIKRYTNIITCHRGFTLIELILVCMLIGLLLVLCLPSLRESFINDPLKTGSRKISAKINAVRMLAVKTQNPYFIHFDHNKKLIWHSTESTPPIKSEQYKIDITKNKIETRDIIIKSVWSYTTGKSDNDISTLWVNSKGYVDPTVIHLTDNKNRKLSLILSPFIPEIEILDGFFQLSPK